MSTIAEELKLKTGRYRNIDERLSMVMKLKGVITTVPRYNQFSEDVHEAMNKQIEVIMNNPAEEELYSAGGDMSLQYLEQSARTAWEWLNKKISDEQLLF